MTVPVVRARPVAARPLLSPLSRAAAMVALGVALPALAADAPQPGWEGALGLLASNSPEYPGAAGRVSKLAPGFYLRYGRLTVTNASGFVTRRSDDVERGLGVDLSPGDRVKIKLALRFDGGRSESDSSALKGLGDVKRTVRARLSGVWQPDLAWKLGASWSPDLLARGGGNLADLSLQHETYWRTDTLLSLGATLTWADARHLQTYFGVSPAQSESSGYAAYSPAAGMRDIALSASLNRDLGAHWVALGGLTLGRLAGPAADSPLVKKLQSWRVNGGLAYRF